MKFFPNQTILKYADVFLVICVIFGVFVSVNGGILLGVPNPEGTPSPFWLITISFVLAFLSSIIYLYYSYKKNIVKPYHLIVLLTLIICNAIAIFIHPDTMSLEFDRGDAIFTLVNTINLQVKFMFFFMVYCLLIGFYLLIFVLPHRFNVKFIEWLGILILIFVAFLIVYSLITESNNYIGFLKKLFAFDAFQIETYAVQSIFSHRNLFGMYLEFGFLVSLLNFIISHKKLYLYFPLPLLIMMIFTMCKTGIILSFLSFVVFSIFYLVKGIININKKVIILNSIFLSFVIVSFSVVLISYFVNDKMKEIIGDLFQNGISIHGRTLIWKWSLNIIKSNPYIGYGFGVYNSMLYLANSILIPDKTSVTHSWILSILGRGGIVNLLVYLFILGYSMKHLINVYSKNLDLGVIFSIFFLAFFLHSFVEDNYYVVLLICFEIITASTSLTSKEKQLIRVTNIQQ